MHIVRTLAQMSQTVIQGASMMGIMMIGLRLLFPLTLMQKNPV